MFETTVFRIVPNHAVINELQILLKGELRPYSSSYSENRETKNENRSGAARISLLRGKHTCLPSESCDLTIRMNEMVFFG